MWRSTVDGATRVLGSIALLIVAACGGRTDPGGRAITDGGSVADSGIEPATLDTWWMQAVLGNCINTEEWLHLAQPAALSHAVVDRDFCGPHSVTRVEGAVVGLPQSVVRMSWNDGTSHVTERTMIVLDPAPQVALPGPLPDPSYQLGTRALAGAAFVASGNGFIRRAFSDQTAPLEHWSSEVSLSLTLDPGPSRAKPGDACKMHVDVQGRAVLDGTVDQGTFAADFACVYRTSPSTGWLEVVTAGKDTPFITWEAAIEAADLPPLTVRAIGESFIPDLLVPPGRSDAVIMMRDLYVEMRNAPPTSVK